VSQGAFQPHLKKGHLVEGKYFGRRDAKSQSFNCCSSRYEEQGNVNSACNFAQKF
jgi:hypothetical protein